MEIETLFQQHGDRLLRAAYFLCHNETDAQDLVQETFFQAIDAMERFKGESKEYTWLYGIMRNQYFNYLRKKSRWFSLDLLFNHPAETVDPWIEINKFESHRQLEQALKILPFKQREILMLRYVEEMKVDEIARVIKISAGTVKSRLHNATRRLREKLLSNGGKMFQPMGGGKLEM